MLKRISVVGTAAALAIAMSAAVQAKVPATEAAKLGTSAMTPMGAQVSGNGKDVATGLGIPAWTGGITRNEIPKSYTQAGQHHPDPFESDKVLFTITNQNQGQYADKLPEGIKAMLRTYPDTFKLNVYQSRRTTSAPDWVNKYTKDNAARTVLTDTGVENSLVAFRSRFCMARTKSEPSRPSGTTYCAGAVSTLFAALRKWRCSEMVLTHW